MKQWKGGVMFSSPYTELPSKTVMRLKLDIIVLLGRNLGIFFVKLKLFSKHFDNIFAKIKLIYCINILILKVYYIKFIYSYII